MPNLISSGVAISARSKLRRHPRMQRTVVRVLSLGRPREGYEQSFRSVMLRSTRPGDCVWDVGANIGFYSELFAMVVGPSGKVISFEPSRACVSLLEERLRDRACGPSWRSCPSPFPIRMARLGYRSAPGDTAPSNHLASRGEDATVLVQTAPGRFASHRGM